MITCFYISYFLLCVLEFLSVFGYGTFILHPQLLVKYQWALPIFSHSFTFFSQSQVIVAFCVLILLLHLHGVRWTPIILLALGTMVTGLMFELSGTMYGVPFGKYFYTDLLGYKILGHVPYTIPLSWFVMAIPSYVCAFWVLLPTEYDKDRKNWLKKNFQWLKLLFIGAILLTLWDVTLEPAMSSLLSYWGWNSLGSTTQSLTTTGFAAGFSEKPTWLSAPLSNLFGWLMTSFCMMGLIHFFYMKDFFDISTRLIRSLILFYTTLLLFPFSMVLVALLFRPIIVTSVVIALLLSIKFYDKLHKRSLYPYRSNRI